MNKDLFSSYENINKVLNSKSLKVGETCDEFNIFVIAMDFEKNNQSLFVVLPNLFMAQKYYDELINIVNDEDVLFYPADELLTAEMLAASGDFKFERINTIKSLLTDTKKIIVTHLNGIIKYQFSRRRWKESIFTIKTNDSYDIHKLSKLLVNLGYESTYTTVKTGQFSRRGSILDVFPLNSLHPYRLDFFDDEIETIKIFDIDSQKSTGIVDSLEIIPVTELIYDDEEKCKAISEIDNFIDNNKLSELELDRISKDKIKLEEHNDVDLLNRYIGFLTKEKNTIFDFVDNKKIYVIDYPKLEENYNHLLLDLEEYSKGMGGYSIFKYNYFCNMDVLQKQDYISIEALRSIGKINTYIGAREVAPFNANRNDITNYLKKNVGIKTVIIALDNKEHSKTMVNTLLDSNIYYKTINDFNNIEANVINIYNKYLPSFELLGDSFVILNDKTIFEISRRNRKIKYKSIYSNATKISKYDELVIGDYVVHYDHGIGKYLGIVSMTNEGITRDYLHIMYAKEGALYIPIEQINSVMKYASADVENVKLNTIGGTEWARAKQKVRTRVRDISDKLIKLYAEREMAQGYKYPPDSEYQSQFESDFMYELTKDQQKAIDDVKSDMESSRPMDRLICGDVGYGKTEVALRAAFKAVYSGKQVAVLAPTTVLSRQHFYTFKNRMDKYAIRVELLNRFISMKQQKEIIQKIKSGEVDVIIGTHRILSDEIKFHDLGLLVVDEEQRFGVTHKEKIKELKVNVDALTLSATPIPRTLQMSIVGIKDLSMIETPPKNRYPVQTYVLERNNSIIREAIERELARGGQVFYLYNKVDSIELIAAKIHDLVPSARIGIGHGRLTKDKLESVITQFIDKEFDILLCTTIIETGIDMPDTNTLIIHDADHLGLSQLYQIRGRVGRSNRIAYAYLMYEPRKILSEIAEKRLETIKEFNELGSGFKIAMRDLSIRGSGDLLGEDQSGFIDSVGLDVYMKILDEEIKKKKIGPVLDEKIEADSSINFPLASRHIDDNYISNEDIKIEIHKKIDKLNSINDLKLLGDELDDRFGGYNTEIETYMYEKLLKNLCKKLDIYKIDNKSANITLFMTSDKSKTMDGNKMFEYAINTSKDLKLTYKYGEIRIMLDTNKYSSYQYIKILTEYLNKLV